MAFQYFIVGTKRLSHVENKKAYRQYHEIHQVKYPECICIILRFNFMIVWVI